MTGTNVDDNSVLTETRIFSESYAFGYGWPGGGESNGREGQRHACDSDRDLCELRTDMARMPGEPDRSCAV